MTSTTTGKVGGKDDLRLQANLQVLKRKDPLVSHIVDSTPHVTLYRYVGGADAGGWTKEGIEGTMFLFARTTRPTHGIFIMNRLSTSNYYLPLTSDLVWLPSGDYLMFKAHDHNTYGIWFFEKADRAKFFEVISHLCKQEEEQGAPAQVSQPTSTAAAMAVKGSASRTAVPSSAQLLASAQNDLMGMIQRARGSSGSADPGSTSINSTLSASSTTVTTASAPVAVGGDSDMARLMAKLSTASPALGSAALDTNPATLSSSTVPARQPSPARAKSPAKKPTKPQSASPTKPTATPTPAAAPASPTKPTGPMTALGSTPAPVDPFRLAHATMSLMHAFPPGLPSREALRDTLIARVTSDQMFLDAVWTMYAQMSAAAAGMGMPPPAHGGAAPPAPSSGMGMGIRPGAMPPQQHPMGPGAPMHFSAAGGGGPVFGTPAPAPQPLPPPAHVNGLHAHPSVPPHVSPASMALGMGGLPLAAGSGAVGHMGLAGPQAASAGAPPAGMYSQHQQGQARGGQGMMGGYPQQR